MTIRPAHVNEMQTVTGVLRCVYATIAFRLDIVQAQIRPWCPLPFIIAFLEPELQELEWKETQGFAICDRGEL